MPKKPSLAILVPSWIDDITDLRLDNAIVEALIAKRRYLRIGADLHHQGILAGDAALQAIADGRAHGEAAMRKAAAAHDHYDRIWSEESSVCAVPSGGSCRGVG